MSIAESEPLLSAELIARLEQLEIVSRRILAGRMKGERRSKRRGSSVEFADHRNYVVGDDLRFIDWNILIRLDKLVMKLFEEEEDLHVHILIDASASMDFGEPRKFRYAKQVAAALAAIALIGSDRVGITCFSTELGAFLPAARGRSSLTRVLDFLSRQPTGGGSDLAASCRQFALRQPQRGLVILLSDFLDKGGFEAGLRYLLARQFDIYLVHILAAEEVTPSLDGDLRLVDAEDGSEAEITMTAPLLARYRENLRRFRTAIEQFCLRRGIHYTFTTNQQPFERLVLTYLRRRGLLA